MIFFLVSLVPVQIPEAEDILEVRVTTGLMISYPPVPRLGHSKATMSCPGQLIRSYPVAVCPRRLRGPTALLPTTTHNSTCPTTNTNTNTNRRASDRQMEDGGIPQVMEEQPQ